MSMLKLCLASASQQFIVYAKTELLSANAKAMMATVTLALAAAAVATPTPAQAQMWGGQTAAAQANNSVLPQNSAGRWGDLLGGSLGRVLGAGVGGGSNTELGRRMQDVVSGVSEEVGRNVGRRAAERPYQNVQNAQDVQASPTAQAQSLRLARYVPQTGSSQDQPHAGSIALVGHLLPYQVPFSSVHHQDNLDLLALKAVVANDDLARARMVPVSSNSSRLDNLNVLALTSFELALRTAQEQGVNIQPWVAVRSAVLSPVGSIAQAQFVALGAPMIERLSRPGGPGVTALDLSYESQVSGLRSVNTQRQQAAVRSMPIENFGR